MIRRSTLAGHPVHRLASALAMQAAQRRTVAGDPHADSRHAFSCLLCDRLAAEMIGQHATPEGRALAELDPFATAPDVVVDYLAALGFSQHPQNARQMLVTLAELVLAKVTEPAPEPAPAV